MLPTQGTLVTQRKPFSEFSMATVGARLLSTAINTMSKYWARTTSPRAKRMRENGSDFHF